ncbi:hypothetical protein [Pseudomonas sp. MPB23]|uniref:hypothetical protein n=1 Tax=Pseudomonas sp. MPB23 TaxID=3388490 RepID=UPI0039846761
MAEPINLAPVRVHAISLPMRPDPTQLHTFDEMMLQANGDDTVHVDIFGTDPQGKPYHESRTVNEQEYEQLRRYHLERELANMPPFSSFKNGNTIGRVVGETAPATVPATQANPPIETETEAEKGWWASASPWVHGGLDVLGFVPGLGAIPDLINAGIYAAEGDAVNASLSAVAAIPFAGDALKGSVLIGKSINKAGAQSGREVSERAARTIETKAIDPPSPKGKNGGKFLGSEKCLLRPYKPDTCKAKGLTGHHVVPDRAFRQGPRQGPDRKQIPGGLSESEGLVICVKGKGLTDQHGKIHRIYDPLETALGLSETPPGTTTLLKLEVMGALAVARVTGCNSGLLAAQLRTYHETKGLPSQLRVRADKSGKIIKSTPPGSLGKVGAGDF